VMADIPSRREKPSTSQACCIICGRTGSWVDPFPRVARCTVTRKAFDVTPGG
jgi:hypothetical protein